MLTVKEGVLFICMYQCLLMMGQGDNFGIAFILMCCLVRFNMHTDEAHQAPLEESFKKNSPNYP